MSKKRGNLPVLLCIAAWVAYRCYKGQGIFNKVRYKAQHEAVSNYVETHYPNAFYSDIIEADNGWSCIVTDGGRKIVLYLTKTDSGTFIFWEKAE
ncbi:MAG: hypothetical protein IKS12_01880 [Eubacterium sp.]|nr:hypothetical protein [Eubacterium sp.]